MIFYIFTDEFTDKNPIEMEAKEKSIKKRCQNRKKLKKRIENFN